MDECGVDGGSDEEVRPVSRVNFSHWHISDYGTFTLKGESGHGERIGVSMYMCGGCDDPQNTAIVTGIDHHNRIKNLVREHDSEVKQMATDFAKTLKSEYERGYTEGYEDGVDD